jgi:hypothetical protein
MTKYEMRQIAAGAARSLLRKIGLLNYSATVEDADMVLDELSRDPANEKLIAVQWFKYSSDNQYDLFAREWKRWQRKTKQDEEDLATIKNIINKK